MQKTKNTSSDYRLRAHIIHQDEQHVSVNLIQIENISDDIENIQLKNPRNSNLTIGFGTISVINILVGLLTKCFPDSIFIGHLFIISLSIAFLTSPFFFYHYFKFKPQKSKTLEKIKVLASKHMERNTPIHDMPFNQPPPIPLNPPPNSGLRIESG